MATPGNAHEAMVEAFAKRINEVFPNAHCTLGKVDKCTGLKPDIFIEMEDQKWAFEMVHGNQSPKKIQSNHTRYKEAGGKDTWILWDSLRPKAGKRKSVDQGFFNYRNQDQPRYHLTLPQKAILNLQEGPIRYIFAFTCDPTGVGPEVVTSDLLRAMMIGVNIYKFKDWNGEDRFAAESTFVPMSELNFDRDGQFIFPEEEDTPITDFVMNALGFDPNHMFVRSSIENLQNLLSTKEGLKQIADLGLMYQISNLSPEELVEIQEFSTSGAVKKIEPFKGKISLEEAHLVFQDPDKMALLAEDTQGFFEYVNTAPIPGGLKKVLINLFNDRSDLSSLSNFMHLQSTSENFRNLFQSPQKDA